MATQSAPTSGLLVFDGRLVDGVYLEPVGVASTSSTYTQSGSLPGLVVSEDGGNMVPVLSGGQGSETVSLRVQRSGFADKVGVWYSLDGGTNKRGWNGAKFQGWEPLTGLWVTSPSWDLSSSVLIPKSQKIVTVYATKGSGSVYCQVRTSSGWSSAYTITANPAEAIVVYLTPDQSRLILVRVTSDLKIATHYSDDDGVTWSFLAYKDDIGTTLSATVHGFACGTFIGNDMVFFYRRSSTNEYWYQYASSDYGTSWSLVDSWTGTLDPRFISVSSNGTEAIALASTPNTTPTTLTSYLMSSAFTPFDEGTPAQVATTVNNILKHSVHVDQSGAIYAAYTDGAAGGWIDTNATISEDGGLTWAAGRSVAVTTGTNYGFVVDQIVAQFGELHCLHRQQIPGGGSYSDALGDCKFTRWTTVEFDGNPVATWHPAALPTPWDARYVLTGAAVASITTGHLRIQATGAASYYTYTHTAHSLTCAVNCVASNGVGGNVASNDAILRLYATSASQTFTINIRLDQSTSQFRVLDGQSGATITTVSYDVSNDTEFLFGFDAAGSGFLYYKDPNDVDFIKVTAVSSHSFTDGGALHGAWFFEMGVHTASTTTFWAQWVALYNSIGSIVDGNNLLGRKITGKPYPLYGVVDGDGNYGHLHIRGGFGSIGHDYTIAPRYTYGLENALIGVSPSPFATEWRSTDLTEQKIVFDFSTETLIGEGVGLLLQQVNFATAYLEYWNGSAWTTIGTYNGANGSSLTYDLVGETITPRSGTGLTSRPIHENELSDGGWVQLPSSKNRYVRDNCGGWWTDASGTTRCQINLKDVDGTEAANGSVTIVSSGGVGIWYPGTVKARYWRVRIPNQQCPDAYFKAGVIAIGRVLAFSQDWGWGWSREINGRYESFVDRAGVEVRTRLGVAHAESWTFDFSDGVDSTDYFASDAAPYVGITGAELAVEGSVLWTLRGAVDRSQSQTIPMVAVADLPGSSGGTVLDPTMYLYGYMSASVGSSQSAGFEGVDQIDRIESIRMDKVVG